MTPTSACGSQRAFDCEAREQRTEPERLGGHVGDEARAVGDVEDGGDEVGDRRPDENPSLELEVVGDPLCWECIAEKVEALEDVESGKVEQRDQTYAMRLQICSREERSSNVPVTPTIVRGWTLKIPKTSAATAEESSVSLIP